MVINNAFNFGDIVYLKTDKEQSPRIVTRMSVGPENITYCLACGIAETWHHDFEITVEKDILTTLTN